MGCSLIQRLIMDEIREKYDYEPFADTEEYREVNEACIHLLIAKLHHYPFPHCNILL